MHLHASRYYLVSCRRLQLVLAFTMLGLHDGLVPRVHVNSSLTGCETVAFLSSSRRGTLFRLCERALLDIVRLDGGDLAATDTSRSAVFLGCL